MSTIKPLNSEAVLSAARATKAIVTAEERNVIGGLGGAVAELVAEVGVRVPVRRVGLRDRFAESGGYSRCSISSEIEWQIFRERRKPHSPQPHASRTLEGLEVSELRAARWLRHESFGMASIVGGGLSDWPCPTGGGFEHGTRACRSRRRYCPRPEPLDRRTRRRGPAGEHRRPSTTPRPGQVIARVPRGGRPRSTPPSSPRRRAFPAWRDMPLIARSNIFFAFRGLDLRAPRGAGRADHPRPRQDLPGCPGRGHARPRDGRVRVRAAGPHGRHEHAQRVDQGRRLHPAPAARRRGRRSPRSTSR